VASNIQDILRLGGELWKTEFEKKMNQYNMQASGRTVASIDPQINGNVLTIFGADHIQTVQDGRRPTRNEGDGVLLRAIKEWVRYKGLPIEAAYPITKKIHQQGTMLFAVGKSFGGATRPTDVLEVPTERTITYIQKEATIYYSLVVRTEIVNVLKKQFV
jgi:hypothetical protein